MEYIIVGDSDKYGYKGCLVRLAGHRIETAKEILDRMLNCPDELDVLLSMGISNLRIEQVEEKDCWWNDPFLVN